MGFTDFMIAINMTVDNFSAYTCSHCIMASTVMSFKITTEQCFVKGFKTEDNSMLNLHYNQQLLIAPSCSVRYFRITVLLDAFDQKNNIIYGSA